MSARIVGPALACGALAALTLAPACRLVDEPPDAAYACRVDDPVCPGDEVCVVDGDGDTGVCGVPAVCLDAIDEKGVARAVEDCRSCEPETDDGGAGPHACVAGACVPVACGSPCHAAVCGDACLDGEEACDDGNTTGNDGCAGTCALEPGWFCDGEPSSCATVCGDAVAAGSEVCDDGNDNPADTCATCRAVGWQLDDGAAALPPGPPGATLDVRTAEHCVVACVDGGCTTVGTCGEAGVLGDHLFAPLAAVFGRDPAVLYVADTGNHRVLRVDAAGTSVVLGTGEPSSIGDGAPARALPVKSPDGVAVDGYGNLFVTSDGRIREVANVDGDVDADGDDAVTNVDTCGPSAHGVAVDGDTVVVIVDGAPRRCVRGDAP